MNTNALEEIKKINYEDRPLDMIAVDPRVFGLIDNVDIKGKTVLDIGTLDGLHACQIAQAGGIVCASDIRPQNLFRALYRALYLGLKDITYRLLDMETMHEEIKIDEFFAIFHSGCFYHLSNPIKHLKNICKLSEYILLETHMQDNRYEQGEIDGYKGSWFNEGSWQDSRAAKDNRRSFWLTNESMEQLFKDCNLELVKIVYKGGENPHGVRNCYLLRRK